MEEGYNRLSVSASKSNMNSNGTRLNEEQFVNEREIGERYERKLNYSS